MKKILAFNGSARKYGNTWYMLDAFLKGVDEMEQDWERFEADKINLEYCNGCLRCNLLKRCSIRGDDWSEISDKILQSDVLVFASPVYFHHVSAQMKKIIDRFRSFVHVQITETGLLHKPHHPWNKDFVLLLTLGSSSSADAQPVIELFKYMVEILGPENRLHIIIGNRLGVVKQIVKSKDELAVLYPKLGLRKELVEQDAERNKEILKNCFELGEKLSQ